MYIYCILPQSRLLSEDYGMGGGRGGGLSGFQAQTAVPGSNMASVNLVVCQNLKFKNLQRGENHLSRENFVVQIYKD